MANEFKFEWVVVKSKSSETKKPAGSKDLLNDTIMVGVEKKDVPVARSEDMFKVATERLSPGELQEVRSEKDHLVDAPIIPISLIRSTPAAINQPAPQVSWGISAIGADKSAFCGKGVKVAVLDTGVNAAHPAFTGVKLDASNMKNFTTDKEDHDVDGHGTHCAGTIFGRDVDGKRIGVARGVEDVLTGKVIGREGGMTTDILKAIQWAQAMGADVISMSLGMDFPAFQEALIKKHGMPSRQATSIALEAYLLNVRMFDRLSNSIRGDGALFNGSAVFAAAGNESMLPSYSIHVAPPANAEYFVSVGAFKPLADNANEYELASFSCIGGRFGAPGTDIWSANKDGGLTAMSGTSMATPHVAGLACLWAQKLRADKKPANAMTIVEALERSCRPLPRIKEDEIEKGAPQAP